MVAVARELPPPSPVPGPDYSARFLVPTSVLYTFALFLSVARIYSRIRPQFRMAWDDYTLISALVSVTNGAAQSNGSLTTVVERL